jgi:hypothetical protein
MDPPSSQSNLLAAAAALGPSRSSTTGTTSKKKKSNNNSNNMNVDICITCVTDKPPQLPLREELASLGIEVARVYNAQGIGARDSQDEAQKELTVKHFRNDTVYHDLNLEETPPVQAESFPSHKDHGGRTQFRNGSSGNSTRRQLRNLQFCIYCTQSHGLQCWQ